MSKNLLLTKSNLRKNRGTSVGLFVLMMIATCLIGVSLLIFFDAYPMARKEAQRLNAGDGFFFINGNTEGFTDEKIHELIGNDTEEYYVYHNLMYSQMSLPFGDGDVNLSLLVSDIKAFERPMETIEIIKEDESIKEPFVYLPYQFETSGGFKIGDVFEYENAGTEYRFNVKGFTEIIYSGCNNSGSFEFVIDDNSYEKLWNKDHVENENIKIIYDLKDGVNNGKFRIKTSNEMLKVSPGAVVESDVLDNTVFSRTFISLIIAVSFLVLTTLIVIAVALMLANCISNYIRENMKTLGALKAIGYTGGDIRSSLVLWFFMLSVIAGIAGNIVSYLLMPVLAKIIVGQMGLPYHTAFNPASTFISLGFVIIFTLITTVISARKISKIQPIVALREGLESHNFKKNHIALDRSALGLNASLAMKTFFRNMKQNVITFIVVGFMVFSCVISLLMYENFSRNPKLEILTTELCAGVVAVDIDTTDEMRDYLNERSDIKNVREMFSLQFYYNDEDKLTTYVVKDTSKMNNKALCYKGRLPEYDNEVVVSGNFAKNYGFEIGDEIKLDYGDESYTYLITGLIQTANNGGREALLTYEAADHLMDMESVPGWFWYDLAEESGEDNVNKEETGKINDEFKEKYGDHVLNTMNFYEILGGSMTTFKSISVMMLIAMCVISVIVIALILFLLIKSLIYNKRRDYGIYKALGYTSGALSFQTALSFLPAIIASVIVFSFVSYNVANPYITMMMSMFGLMKVSFTIPIPGVIMIAVGLTVISFLLALIQTRKIRKIEAYNMLVSE